MFEKAAVHNPVVGRRFDLGLLVETMLYYDDTLLLINRGSLKGLIEAIGVEGVLELRDSFGLKISFHREMHGTVTSTNGGIKSNNLAIFTVTPQKAKIRDCHQEMKWQLEELLGKGRRAEKSIRKLLKSTGSHVLGANEASLVKSTKEDLSDPTYLRYSVEQIINACCPGAELPPRGGLTLYPRGMSSPFRATSILTI